MAEPKSQRAICLEFECLYDRYAREKLAQVYRISVPAENDPIQTTAEELSHENAAIYARVSSDRQREQNTIASQTALLLEYAKAHDCVMPKEWIFGPVLGLRARKSA